MFASRIELKREKREEKTPGSSGIWLAIVRISSSSVVFLSWWKNWNANISGWPGKWVRAHWRQALASSGSFSSWNKERKSSGIVFLEGSSMISVEG